MQKLTSKAKGLLAGRRSTARSGWQQAASQMVLFVADLLHPTHDLAV
jgi:hypothetical protein